VRYFYNSKLSSKQQSRARLFLPPPHGTVHFATPASSTSNGPHSPQVGGQNAALHSTTLDVWPPSHLSFGTEDPILSRQSRTVVSVPRPQLAEHVPGLHADHTISKV